MKNKVLISITTAFDVDWRSQIEWLKKSEIREIALFLTSLEPADRKICLDKLSSIKGLKISFVHARSDMKKEEYRFLIDNFDTEFFNLHSQSAKEFPWDPDAFLFKNQLLIESANDKFDPNEVKDFKGLCLDMAHHENDRRLREESFRNNEEVIKVFPIFANHIGPILAEPKDYGNGIRHHDSHMLHDLTELDYLKNYSAKYFGKYLALELMNPLIDQLKAKEYVESILAFDSLG